MPIATTVRIRPLVLAGLLAVACDNAQPTPQGDAPSSASASSKPKVARLGPSASAVWVSPSPSSDAAKSAVASSTAPPPPPVFRPPVYVTGLEDKLEALQKLANKGVLPPGEADKVIAQGGAPLGAIVDTGKAPAKELVYDLQPKSKETVVMTSDNVMTRSAGAKPLPDSTLPQMSLTLTMVTADKREANGDMKLSGALTEVSVGEGATEEDKATSKDFLAALVSVKGLGLSYYVTPRGWARDLTLDVPTTATDEGKVIVEQLRQAFTSLMAPLPEGKVGEGGKWLIATRSMGAADAIQWTTYTLKKRKGDAIEVEAASVQLAAAPIMNAGTPMAANIDGYVSSGIGTMAIDLKKIFPDQGSIVTNNVTDLRIGPRTLTLGSKAKVQFTSR